MTQTPSLIRPTDPAVEAELKQLAATPMIELRIRYQELFQTDPPKAFGLDLICRSIAHRIQKDAYGKLSRSSQRLLDQITIANSTKSEVGHELSRRIKSGSEIVRTWKGKSYRVIVMRDGFTYDGKIYPGLSEIATLITGTRWNGPRFFGLRSKPKTVSADGK